MDSELLHDQTPTAGIRLILGYLCVFIAFVGGITLLPLVMIAAFPDEWVCFPAFAIPGGLSLIVGGIVAYIFTKGKQKGKLGKFQDSVLLVLIWLVTVLIGAMPFFLADKVDFFGANNGALSMNYSESVFESMSGYCAVGYTVMHGFDSRGSPVYSSFIDTNIGYCPHIFLFYRAITQFFGGVGLVLVVASAVSDRFGMQLFVTEGHNDRLLPNLAKTAKATFGIYTAIIILGTLSMWLFGMDWFEALCHSISGMATGGFSTRVSGFYQYTNPNPILGSVMPIGIEVTMIVIMILGATSFLLIFNALTMRWKNFFRDCEIRFMGGVILIFTLLSTFFIMLEYNEGAQAGLPFSTALRYGAFQIISCLTTTGFGNAPSILVLGQGTIFLSILMMLIGGGMGSTAGAIKQFRVVVALKSLWWSIRYKFSPSRMYYPRNVIRAGKTVEITEEMYKENTQYIVLYIFVLLVPSIGMLFLPKSGDGTFFSSTESFYLVASSLSGTGNTIVDFLGIRQSMNAMGADGMMWSYYVVLWLMSLCMILGRLEILPIYYAARRLNRLILRREVI